MIIKGSVDAQNNQDAHDKIQEVGRQWFGHNSFDSIILSAVYVSEYEPVGLGNYKDKSWFVVDYRISELK